MSVMNRDHYDGETDKVYCSHDDGPPISSVFYVTAEIKKLVNRYKHIFTENPNIEVIQVTEVVDFDTCGWYSNYESVDLSSWEYRGLKISSDGVIWIWFSHIYGCPILEFRIDLA